VVEVAVDVEVLVRAGTRVERVRHADLEDDLGVVGVGVRGVERITQRARAAVDGRRNGDDVQGVCGRGNHDDAADRCDAEHREQRHDATSSLLHHDLRRYSEARERWHGQPAISLARLADDYCGGRR
jgi:hypothetical protein